MMRVHLRLAMAVHLLALLPITVWAGDSESVSLDHAAIVADAAQPSFVQYGVKDLAAYIKELTANEVAITTVPDGRKTVQILVGPESVGTVFPQLLSEAKLCDEAYLLRVMPQNEATYVIATGATPRGTKIALGMLMKAIRTEGRFTFVPAKLDVCGKPTFSRRGIHFNGWPVAYPYTFWSWREEDWHRYLDILAYQNVNLLFFLPLVERMPLPLSSEDQELLREYRRMVDYAHEKHGMEVWMFQCTNRVAYDDCGVTDPRHRPIWRPCQKDLDPRNPEQFADIMASREAMYKIIDNVDGVVNIDSDPGYSQPGATIEDYLKVLQGCRAMLDRYNVHGKETKLIHWMWMGWAAPKPFSFIPEHQAATIRALKQGLPEPWGLISGKYEFLPVCREEGVLGKTVLLPYNEIEYEPSYPTTNVQLDRMRTAFDDQILQCPELTAVIGNVQAPLIQFPHVFFFTSVLSDLDYRKHSEKEVLMDLAGHLYPSHRELLTDCYLAMKEADPTKIEALSAQLDRLVQEDKLGPLGAFGRKLFPDHRIVAQSMVLQLNVRAAFERLAAGVTTRTPKPDCEKLVYDYLDASLAWDTAHGWLKLWGPSFPSWLDSSRVSPLYGRINISLGGKPGVTASFDQLSQSLCAKYPEGVALPCFLNPWKNAVLAAEPVSTLAQKATASASASPDSKYPPNAGNDGDLSTPYWPGALVSDNTEWFQLTWGEPQRFQNVVVRFLQHPSMLDRTIHLQREIEPGRWEDFAATVIPKDDKARHAVAAFVLPSQVTLDKIRVVNLLDLFEIEVY